jgi:hypothetical protein
LFAIEPRARGARGGELPDQLIEVGDLVVGELAAVLEQRPPQPFERGIGPLLRAPRFVYTGSIAENPTCEGCMSIDVRRWHREGLLHAGQRFPVAPAEAAHAFLWTDPEQPPLERFIDGPGDL